MDKTSLERDWRAAFAPLTGGGDRQRFLNFFDPAARFVDEDNPFIMDYGQFADHLAFHGSGIWESFTWKPRDPVVQVFGSTGLVSGNFTLRGKPADAGYRQRHGVFTVVCAYDAARKSWTGLCLHFSPMLSHIHSNSPG